MKDKISLYDSVILVLSLYVIAELIFSCFVEYELWLISVTSYIDTIICTFFIYDFFSRLKKSDNKSMFWKFNIIDLISSIPYAGVLRFGRIFRVLRLLRILRSGKQVAKIFKKRKSITVFKMVVYLNIILILIGSLSLITLKNYNADKISFENAIWDSLKITLFSELPDDSSFSFLGKIIVLLMAVGGMVLFGAFIGLISDIFISPEEKKLDDDITIIKEQNKEILKRLDELSVKDKQSCIKS